MTVVHMSESEVARDLHGVLLKVREGVEVVIEQDRHAVAVLRASARSGRLISDILREARKRNSTATLDDGFGSDLEDIIRRNSQPWQPPTWD